MTNARDKANIPVLNFQSKGIDDNADATAITIDSSERIVLTTTGSTSSSPNLAIKDSGQSGTGAKARVGFLDSGNTVLGEVGYLSGGNHELSIKNIQNSDITFFTNNAEKMRLTSTGLGIGTTSPNAITGYGGLTIAGNTWGGFLDFEHGSTLNSSIVGASNGLNILTRINQPIMFKVNGSEAMRILSNGAVLAGTTSSLQGTSHSFQALGTSNSFYAGTFKHNGSGASGRVFSWQLPNTNSSSSYFVYATNSDGNCFNIFGNGNTEIRNSSGAELILSRNDTSIAVDDLIGGIQFKANDASSSPDPQICGIKAISTGATNTNPRLDFFAGESNYNSNTPNMSIDSSGAVSIGHSTSGGSKFAVCDGANAQIQFFTEISTDTNLIQHYDPTASAYMASDNRASEYLFKIGTAEKLRIGTSGRFHTNTSTSPNGHLNLVGERGGSYRAIVFEHTGGGGSVGDIRTGSSSVTYNTSSDYRLKENVSYDFDATSRLKQLKPARFNFKTDADTTVDGFLAHEVSSIVPEAISGTKDETETKQKVIVNSKGNVVEENIEKADWEKGKIADSEGNTQYPTDSTWEATKVIPVYQSIDQSKLVPLLVKTIQELEARITTLEANNQP